MKFSGVKIFEVVTGLGLSVTYDARNASSENMLRFKGYMPTLTNTWVTFFRLKPAR